MVGKAQTRITPTDRLNKGDILRREQYGISRMLRSGNISRVGSSSQLSAQQVSPSQSGLPITGGAMSGAIAFNHKYASLNSGVIDISSTGSSYTTLVYINGTPGNLTTIANAHDDGQFLILFNATGGAVTIKNNSINIITTTGSDVTFLNNQRIILFYESLSQFWFQITPLVSGSFANTSLSNLTSPTAINQNLVFGDGVTYSQAKQIINVDTITFKSTSAFLPYIVGNGSNNQFNIGAHGTDIAVLQNSYNVSTGVPDNGILEIFGTSHGVHSGTLWVPSLKTVNLSSTVVNGDYVGGLYMDAFDSGLTERTFGAIFTIAKSISGSLSGKISFQTIVSNGSGLQEIMSVSDSSIGVNSDITPGGFLTVNNGTPSFPFKNIYGGALKYLNNVINLSGTDMTYTAASSNNHKFLINSTTLFGVETDNTYGDVGYIDLYQTHIYTAANSGSASSLPSTPAGYIIIRINGARVKVPYYNV